MAIGAFMAGVIITVVLRNKRNKQKRRKNPNEKKNKLTSIFAGACEILILAPRVQRHGKGSVGWQQLSNDMTLSENNDVVNGDVTAAGVTLIPAGKTLTAQRHDHGRRQRHWHADRQRWGHADR